MANKKEEQKITEEKVEEVQGQTVEETAKEPEVKEEPKQEETCTVFGKIDKAILDRREKKAKKKAEKQPVDKAKKAAMIGGGIAVGIGVLGLVGRAFLGAAERYVEEDQQSTVEVGNCEVVPELPPKTEDETVPEKKPETESEGTEVKT